VFPNIKNCVEYMSKLKFIIIFISIIFINAKFEDLDKNPKGIYAGQILVNGTISLGFVNGSLIDAENNFVENGTYLFKEINVIKEVDLSHINLSASINSEYIIIDYLGIKGTLSKDVVIQKTSFGTDYANSKGNLLEDYSFVMGPCGHITNRKPYDLALYPFIGLSLIDYYPAPVADKLFTGVKPDKISLNSLTYGAAVEGSVFVSNGLFLSLSAKYRYTAVDGIKKLERVQGEKTIKYNNGKSEGSINIFSIDLSCGYAFKN